MGRYTNPASCNKGVVLRCMRVHRHYWLQRLLTAVAAVAPLHCAEDARSAGQRTVGPTSLPRNSTRRHRTSSSPTRQCDRNSRVRLLDVADRGLPSSCSACSRLTPVRQWRRRYNERRFSLPFLIL